MKRILISCFAIAVCIGAPFATNAQGRSPSGVKRATDKAPAPAAQPVVDVHQAFALGTSSERWSIDDPQPSTSVTFAGRNVSLTDRMVNASTTSDGEAQLLFPVSWYEPYQSQNPELKYVVVKYRDGKAASIMAEYQPERVSLPKDQFQPHPDGKTFYSDVAVVRQNGHVYLKQVISKGHDDGNGGYYVDMIIIYEVEDTTAKTATATRRP
ncbi:MAG TPA: hypothetical protein PLF26_02265 [Blastocatellia bacterium]|nr:hypothetical protein [Blastocatellia bacterium]